MVKRSKRLRDKYGPEFHIVDGFLIEAHRSLQDIPLYTYPSSLPLTPKKRARSRPRKKESKDDSPKTLYDPLAPVEKEKVPPTGSFTLNSPILDRLSTLNAFVFTDPFFAFQLASSHVFIFDLRNPLSYLQKRTVAAFV